MKKIETLIRLHKLELDEKRRELRRLEELMQSYIEARARIEVELKEEQVKAKESLENAQTYAGYAKQIIARRAAMDQKIESLKPEIAKQEIVVQMAYQELKKYEITAERQATAERQELLRQEQSQLDETASQAFARKNKS